MLPCVCLVIDHRRCQNVVRTQKVAHEAIAECSTDVFYCIQTGKVPRFFHLLKKVISSLREAKTLCLSFKCEDIGVAMVTNMSSQLKKSFLFSCATGSFAILFTKWLRDMKTVQLPVTFSMRCHILTSINFPGLKNFEQNLPNSGSVLSKNSLRGEKTQRLKKGPS